jgi:hypothetical protein
MALRQSVRRGLINVRTKLTGESPYSRGKRSVVRALNPQISSFRSALNPRTNANVVTRGSVDTMLHVAKGRPRFGARVDSRLRQLSRDRVMVEERGLGRVSDNPHLEIFTFDKLTEPVEYTGKWKKKKTR